MLVRITNKCNLSCSHCFHEGVGPEGVHMGPDTFGQTLDFARKLGVRVVLLSGGEPTLHPNLLEMMHKVFDAKMYCVVTSNGTFTRDAKLSRALVKFVNEHPAMIQVTNDERYYSEPLPDSWVWERPGIVVVDRIQLLRTCRRVRDKGFFTRSQHPNCFNLRSLTRSMGLEYAIAELQARLNRFCVPAVSVDGSVLVGEMDTCRRVGHISDRIGDIEAVIRRMRCSTCGLARHLAPQHKAAIGEA